MDISAIPWVLAIVIAGVLGTLSGFLDNFTADVLFAGKYAQAEKMLFGPLYLGAGIIMLAIFQPNFVSLLPIIMVIGAGVINSIGSIAYFSGLEREETTTATIFGQLLPIFNLVLAWIFLHQAITGLQLAAFAIVLMAPVTVVLMKRKRSKKTGVKAAFFFVLYNLISAISGLLFVSGNELMPEQSFLVVLALFMCGKGIANMVIMAFKKNWRKHFYRRWHEVKWQMLFVVLINFTIWQLADLIYRFTLVQADSVALVSAVYQAVVLIATFFFGVVLSLLWPNFGREKLDKRTVTAHLIATGLALIGILMIK